MYEYLGRKANSAIGEKIVDVSFPIIRIRFLELKRKGSWTSIDWLFSELSQRLNRIVNKYALDIDQSYGRKDIRIDFHVEKSFREIEFSGYYYIPPKSFGNMLTIVVWSFIVFSFGKKPNEIPEGQRILDKYSANLKDFKDYWNRISRNKIPLETERVCHICGEKAEYYNQWNYKKTGRSEVVRTPVCKKHSKNIV